MNVLICDDCIEHAALCEERVTALAKKRGVLLKTRIFPTGDALLFEAEELLPSTDLLYLDIHMPGTDGIMAALKLREMGYAGDIVFFTVNREHAIDGYDADALHYIVKGATTEGKFEEIFEKALSRKRRREREMLVLTCAGESRCIPIEEIRYFEIELRIVTVYYSGESFEFYSTIMRMEEQLYGRGFVRTHKSFLVNRRYIRSLDANEVVLETGERLPVGKNYAHQVKELLRGDGMHAGAPGETRR